MLASLWAGGVGMRAALALPDCLLGAGVPRCARAAPRLPSRPPACTWSALLPAHPAQAGPPSVRRAAVQGSPLLPAQPASIGLLPPWPQVQESLVARRTVFYREHTAGTYSVVPFWAAELLAEVPWVVANSLIYSIIVYFRQAPVLGGRKGGWAGGGTVLGLSIKAGAGGGIAARQRSLPALPASLPRSVLAWSADQAGNMPPDLPKNWLLVRLARCPAALRAGIRGPRPSLIHPPCAVAWASSPMPPSSSSSGSSSCCLCLPCSLSA